MCRQGLAGLVGFHGLRGEGLKDLVDHCIFKAHLFVIKCGTEVLLSHELVPLSLSVQVLVEET